MNETFLYFSIECQQPHHKNLFSPLSQDDKEDEARNLENREALLQLAINAAKVKHSLEKVEYDEMHDLNVQNDIKFLFLSIGLPVGSKYYYLFVYSL